MEKASSRAVRVLRDAGDALAREPVDALATDQHQLYLFSLLPTYGTGMWLGGTLEALTCASVVALYGWHCAEPQLLACGECNARLSFVLPARASAGERRALERAFVAVLQSTHHVACVWRAGRVDPVPLFCPSAHTALAQYHRRVSTWLGRAAPSLAADLPNVGPVPALCGDVERTIFVLSVLGWERGSVGGRATAHCRLCARHVWIDDDAPMDVQRQHRTWCCVLRSRSDMLRLCRIVPPAAQAADGLQVAFENGVLSWQWLVQLLGGAADTALEPPAQALVHARELLRRRESGE